MSDRNRPDILTTIDAALGCCQCGGDLTGSVSGDFCSEACQRGWHGADKVSLSDGGWIAAEVWDDALPRIRQPNWFINDLLIGLFNGETWVWVSR